MERPVVAVVWSVTKARASATPAESELPVPDVDPAVVDAVAVWLAVAENDAGEGEQVAASPPGPRSYWSPP